MILFLLACTQPLPGQADLDLPLPAHVQCAESRSTRAWSESELTQVPSSRSFSVSWDPELEAEASSVVSLSLLADSEGEVVVMDRSPLVDGADCPERLVFPLTGTLALDFNGMNWLSVAVRGSVDSLGALRLDGEQVEWEKVGPGSAAPDIWSLRADTQGGRLRVSTLVGILQPELLWAGSLEELALE